MPLPPLMEGVTIGEDNSWHGPPSPDARPRIPAEAVEPTVALTARVVSTLLRDLHNRPGDLHLSAVEPLVSRHVEPDLIWRGALRFLASMPQVRLRVESVTLGTGENRVALPADLSALIEEIPSEPLTQIGERVRPAILHTYPPYGPTPEMILDVPSTSLVDSLRERQRGTGGAGQDAGAESVGERIWSGLLPAEIPAVGRSFELTADFDPSFRPLQAGSPVRLLVPEPASVAWWSGPGGSGPRLPAGTRMSVMGESDTGGLRVADLVLEHLGPDPDRDSESGSSSSDGSSGSSVGRGAERGSPGVLAPRQRPLVGSIDEILGAGPSRPARALGPDTPAREPVPTPGADLVEQSPERSFEVEPGGVTPGVWVEEIHPNVRAVLRRELGTLLGGRELPNGAEFDELVSQLREETRVALERRRESAASGLGTDGEAASWPVRELGPVPRDRIGGLQATLLAGGLARALLAREGKTPGEPGLGGGAPGPGVDASTSESVAAIEGLRESTRGAQRRLAGSGPHDLDETGGTTSSRRTSDAVGNVPVESSLPARWDPSSMRADPGFVDIVVEGRRKLARTPGVASVGAPSLVSRADVLSELRRFADERGRTLPGRKALTEAVSHVLGADKILPTLTLSLRARGWRAEYPEFVQRLEEWAATGADDPSTVRSRLDGGWQEGGRSLLPGTRMTTLDTSALVRVWAQAALRAGSSARSLIRRSGGLVDTTTLGKWSRGVVTDPGVVSRELDVHQQNWGGFAADRGWEDGSETELLAIAGETATGVMGTVVSPDPPPSERIVYNLLIDHVATALVEQRIWEPGLVGTDVPSDITESARLLVEKAQDAGFLWPFIGSAGRSHGSTSTMAPAGPSRTAPPPYVPVGEVSRWDADALASDGAFTEIVREARDRLVRSPGAANFSQDAVQVDGTFRDRLTRFRAGDGRVELPAAVLRQAIRQVLARDPQRRHDFVDRRMEGWRTEHPQLVEMVEGWATDGTAVPSLRGRLDELKAANDGGFAPRVPFEKRDEEALTRIWARAGWVSGRPIPWLSWASGGLATATQINGWRDAHTWVPKFRDVGVLTQHDGFRTVVLGVRAELARTPGVPDTMAGTLGTSAVFAERVVSLGIEVGRAMLSDPSLSAAVSAVLADHPWGQHRQVELRADGWRTDQPQLVALVGGWSREYPAPDRSLPDRLAALRATNDGGFVPGIPFVSRDEMALVQIASRAGYLSGRSPEQLADWADGLVGVSTIRDWAELYEWDANRRRSVPSSARADETPTTADTRIRDDAAADATPGPELPPDLERSVSEVLELPRLDWHVLATGMGRTVGQLFDLDAAARELVSEVLPDLLWSGPRGRVAFSLMVDRIAVELVEWGLTGSPTAGTAAAEGTRAVANELARRVRTAGIAPNPGAIEPEAEPASKRSRILGPDDVHGTERTDLPTRPARRPWHQLVDAPELSHNERGDLRRAMQVADPRAGSAVFAALPELPEGREFDQLVEFLRARVDDIGSGPGHGGAPRTDPAGRFADAYAVYFGVPPWIGRVCGAVPRSRPGARRPVRCPTEKPTPARAPPESVRTPGPTSSSHGPRARRPRRWTPFWPTLRTRRTRAPLPADPTCPAATHTATTTTRACCGGNRPCTAPEPSNPGRSPRPRWPGATRMPGGRPNGGTQSWPPSWWTTPAPGSQPSSPRSTLSWRSPPTRAAPMWRAAWTCWTQDCPTPPAGSWTASPRANRWRSGPPASSRRHAARDAQPRCWTVPRTCSTRSSWPVPGPGSPISSTTGRHGGRPTGTWASWRCGGPSSARSSTPPSGRPCAASSPRSMRRTRCRRPPWCRTRIRTARDRPRRRSRRSRTATPRSTAPRRPSTSDR